MQEIDHNGLSELLEPLRAKHGKPAPATKEIRHAKEC